LEVQDQNSIKTGTMIDPKRNDEHAKDGEELKGVVTWPLLAALGVS